MLHSLQRWEECPRAKTAVKHTIWPRLLPQKLALSLMKASKLRFIVINTEAGTHL